MRRTLRVGVGKLLARAVGLGLPAEVPGWAEVGDFGEAVAHPPREHVGVHVVAELVEEGFTREPPGHPRRREPNFAHRWGRTGFAQFVVRAAFLGAGLDHFDRHVGRRHLRFIDPALVREVRAHRFDDRRVRLRCPAQQPHEGHSDYSNLLHPKESSAITLKPPNPNIEPRFGEKLSNARLHQILREIQQNFDFLNQQFPLQPGNLANDIPDRRLANPTIVGLIGSNGETAAGTGFTSERTATGIYKIILTAELASPGAIALTKFGTSGEIWVKESLNTKTFVVEAASFAGAAADTPFSFMIKAT